MPSRKDTDPIDAAPLSDSLRALARRGAVRPLRKGVQIIIEGDFGDTLFIVLSGALRAYSVGGDGREITYGNYGAGEYLGEMSLDGGPRSANVEAIQSTLVAIVTRRSLELHLKEEPAFAFDLLAKVIRRARAASMGLKQVALNDVYGRLKDLLERLAVAQHDGTALIDPAPTHLEISQLLACSREMISKVLKDLEKGGYVVVERQRLVLLKKLAAKW